MSWAACCSNKQMQDMFFGESNSAMYRDAAKGRREAACQWCFEHVQVERGGRESGRAGERGNRNRRWERGGSKICFCEAVIGDPDVCAGEVSHLGVRQLQGHLRGVREVRAAGEAGAGQEGQLQDLLHLLPEKLQEAGEGED
eukprot:766398-Hanusia_phi.AAC.1